MKNLIFFLFGIILLTACNSTTPKKSNSSPLPMASLENIDSPLAAKSSYETIKIEKSTTALPSLKVIAPQKNILEKSASFLSKNFKLIDNSQVCESGEAYVETIQNNKKKVYFKNCKSQGIIYDGVAEVSLLSNNTKVILFKNFQLKTDSYNYELKISYSKWYIFTDSELKIEKFNAKAFWNGKTYKYYNFSLHLIDNETTKSYFSGYIYTDCLGGYVKVSTLNGLDYNSENVLSGDLIITSKGKSIRVDFAKDDENSAVYVYITDINGIVESLTLEEFTQINCN